MNIADITWPIYYIGQHDNIYSEYNVTYLVNKERTFIVDNKNLEGITIGQRRLKINDEDIYHFKKTLFSFSELIEFTRPRKISDRKFCDSKGNIFVYKKSRFVPLKCFTIHYVEDYDTRTLIYVKEIQQRFYIPNNIMKPYYMYLYALDFGKYYALYDLSNKPIKDSWRKI